MYRKFYKLSIGRPIIITSQLPGFPLFSFPLFAAGVYLPEGRQPIIPIFQYSNIPTFQLRSEAELSSYMSDNHA